MKKRHQQKLVILSLVLFIGLNFPIVLLADSSRLILGMPATLVYLLLLWLFGSIMSLIIMKKYYE
jgi:hypothetical protein